MQETRLYSLHQAATNGDLDFIKTIKDKKRFNVRDYAGKLPLYYAVKAGHLQTVKFLLEHTKVTSDCLPPETFKAHRDIFDLVMPKIINARTYGGIEVVKMDSNINLEPLHANNEIPDLTDAEALDLTYEYINKIVDPIKRKEVLIMVDLALAKKVCAHNQNIQPALELGRYLSNNMRLSFYWTKLGTKVREPHPAVWGLLADYYLHGFGHFASQADRDKAIFTGFHRCLNEKHARIKLANVSIGDKGAFENALALCYLDGRGTSKNLREAERYLKASAERGKVEAQVNLGFLYKNKDDHINARMWFEKASLNDQPSAKLEMAYYLIEDKKYFEAIQLLQEIMAINLSDHYENRRAEIQDTMKNAQGLLGYAYIWGFGVEKNLLHGIKLIEQVKDVNPRDGYGVLADAYYELGNIEKALKYYHIAAEHGTIEAQRELGYFYLSTDPEKSKQYFLKAARQGHADAQYQVGEYYASQPDSKANRKKVLRWMRMSVDQGNEKAVLALEVYLNKIRKTNTHVISELEDKGVHAVEVESLTLPSTLPPLSVDVKSANVLSSTPSLEPVTRPATITMFAGTSTAIETKEMPSHVPTVVVTESKACKTTKKQKHKPKPTSAPVPVVPPLTPELEKDLEKKCQGSISRLEEHLSAEAYQTLIKIFDTFRQNNIEIFAKGSVVLFFAMLLLKVQPDYSPKDHDIDLEVDCLDNPASIELVQQVAKHCGFTKSNYSPNYINLSLQLSDHSKFELTIRKTKNLSENLFPLTEGKLHIDEKGQGVIEDFPQSTQKALKDKMIPAMLPAFDKKQPRKYSYCLLRLFKQIKKLKQFKYTTHPKTKRYFEEDYLRHFFKGFIDVGNRYDFYGEMAALIKNKLILEEMAKPALNAFIDVLLEQFQLGLKRKKIKEKISIDPEIFRAQFIDKIQQSKIYEEGMMFPIQQLSGNILDVFRSILGTCSKEIDAMLIDRFSYLPPPIDSSKTKNWMGLFNSSPTFLPPYKQGEQQKLSLTC